jgi:hypothetical protein
MYLKHSLRVQRALAQPIVAVGRPLTREAPMIARREPQSLRDLAIWYREFAERTQNPRIWEARLRTAEDLEREADALERKPLLG